MSVEIGSRLFLEKGYGVEKVGFKDALRWLIVLCGEYLQIVFAEDAATGGIHDYRASHSYY